MIKWEYNTKSGMSKAISWKRNAIILGFVEFCVRSMMMLIKPYISLYLPELGVEDAFEVAFWTGLLSSINFIALAITTPIWGKLADVIGRKPMVIRCVLFMGMFNILLSVATTPYQFLIIRFVMGAVSGVNAAATTMVATSTPEKHLGYAIGMIQTGYMAGTLTGPLLGSLLAYVMGYKGCMIFAGVIILLLLPLVIFGIKEEFVRPPKQEKIKKISKAKRIILFKKPVEYKSLAIFTLLLCLTQFALQGSDSFITLYVKEIYTGAYLNLIVAVAFGALAAANVFATTFMGKLGDQFGHVKVLGFCLVLFATSLCLQSFSNVILLIILRILEGVFIAGILPNAYTCIAKLSCAENRGSVLGVAASFVAIGSFIGPNVSGLIGANFSISTIFLVLSTVLMLFSAITLPALKALNIRFANNSGDKT